MRPLVSRSRQHLRRFGVLIAMGASQALVCVAVEPGNVVVLSDDTAVVIHERESFYALDANGVTELRRQLAERGPLARLGHPAAALTRHSIVVEYVMAPTVAGCELADVKVRTEIEMQLPEWKPKRTPAAELSEQWLRVAEALREHESGHRDHGIWASHELLDRLQRLPAAADCRKLALDAMQLRISLISELRDREDAYDLRTNFSKTQLPPQIEDASKRIEREESDRRRARQLLNGF